MSDSFQDFINAQTPSKKGHGERKHSKFSASGADRWFNCPGSVKLSEGIPDKTNKWAEEGTRAHEILETLLVEELSGKSIETARSLAFRELDQFTRSQHQDMLYYASKTAFFVLNLWRKQRGDLMVETRIALDFIHPEAFGTFDAAVIEPFGRLDVIDFKYGKSVVSPRENLQMLFYALGVAHFHHWNFQSIRMWIDQPRAHGYDGPAFWEVSARELEKWAKVFKSKILAVEATPDLVAEGPWCHWCRAKSVCPLKREKKLDEMKAIFSQSPATDEEIFD